LQQSIANFPRDDDVDRHAGLRAIEEDLIVVILILRGTPPFKRRGIEDSESRPAHQHRQRAESLTAMPIVVAPAVFVFLCGIDDLLELFRQEVIGRHDGQWPILSELSISSCVRLEFEEQSSKRPSAECQKSKRKAHP